MKLECNTIGDIENPSKNDVYNAFHDPESMGLSGNVFHLYLDNRTSLASISGEYEKNYSLTFIDENKVAKTCIDDFTGETTMQYFIKAYNGDLSWMNGFDWELEEDSALTKIFKLLNRKVL